MGKMYPQLIVRPNNMRSNMAKVVEMCRPSGIGITGVAKGFSCIPQCAKALMEAGCTDVGGSRTWTLRRIKEFDPTIPTMLTRIPMASEAEEVVRWADTSLVSEVETLKALDLEAGKQGKIHKVIIMKDIGDRREGYEIEDELYAAALAAEKDMPNLYLAGIGANFNCYGSVSPTREKLEGLIACTEKVEELIGRKVDIISTGGTTMFNLLPEGEIPPRINNIRAGITTITRADYTWPADIEGRLDVFRLRAELVELKDKPTLPDGKHGFAALNEERKYEDLGVRRRGIAAVGSQDIGIGGGTITPVDPRIRIWGSSSDHTLLDLEDCKDDYKLGDYVEFNINYVAAMYLTMSPDINIIIEN